MTMPIRARRLLTKQEAERPDEGGCWEVIPTYMGIRQDTRLLCARLREGEREGHCSLEVAEVRHSWPDVVLGSPPASRAGKVSWRVGCCCWSGEPGSVGIYGGADPTSTDAIRDGDTNKLQMNLSYPITDPSLKIKRNVVDPCTLDLLLSITSIIDKPM